MDTLHLSKLLWNAPTPRKTFQGLSHEREKNQIKEFRSRNDFVVLWTEMLFNLKHLPSGKRDLFNLFIFKFADIKAHILGYCLAKENTGYKKYRFNVSNYGM